MLVLQFKEDEIEVLQRRLWHFTHTRITLEYDGWEKNGPLLLLSSYNGWRMPRNKCCFKSRGDVIVVLLPKPLALHTKT